MVNPHEERIVICADCLLITGFTNEKHNEEEFCECGGQFCGCDYCQDFAKKTFDDDQHVIAQAELIDAAKY